MGIKAQEMADMHKYAMICLEQVEMLSKVNKAICSKDFTIRDIQTVQANVSLQIKLMSEYETYVGY